MADRITTLINISHNNDCPGCLVGLIENGAINFTCGECGWDGGYLGITQELINKLQKNYIEKEFEINK